VLLLHRRMPHEQVLAGLRAALDAGALTADAVALEARKLADQHDEHAPPPLPDKTAQAHTAVRSLTEQRLRAHLREDIRPLPSVDKYDRLLSSRRPYRNPS
jgi:hypothetical protein